ncbi:DUF3558 family protein [Gordonia sp. SL306]|uniref:DUF3558 family protein n=1 Tax=Gordonia sp. SL306 TaxID=2995145 RepID=UPI003B6351C0
MVLAASVATGCSEPISGSPTQQSSLAASNTSSGPRQTDDNGVSLPFENRFLLRWNGSNDGTSYEPCTTDPNDLSRIGIDPRSVKDAATVDGQSLRGCTWNYLPPQSEYLAISQTVVDSSDLSWYKQQNQVGSTWLPDRVIGGRDIGVASDTSGSCTTYVQSGGSGVITLADYALSPSKPVAEICGYAIDMVTATINKIPK